jgi:VanZ family protein
MIGRLSRVAFYVGLGLVVALSLIPQDAMPTPDLWDKAGHGLAYGALAVAGGIGYRGLRALILVALGLLLLGAALELAQSALPGRIASLYDVLANAIGILLGSFIASGANTKLRG